MKLERTIRRFPLAAPALGLLAAAFLSSPFLSAQQPPPDAGKQSQNGEPQPGQPIGAAPAGPAMPGGEPGKAALLAPQEAPVAGKVSRMEDALKATARPVGTEQPTFQAAQALRPSGGGGQKGRPAAPEVAGSHLQLVLQVNSDGGAEVASAAEVPGPAPLNDEPLGDYLYEVTDGGTTLAVQALPDPFEVRSFSPPGTTKGHHFARAKSATIVVQVPLPQADAGVERIGLNLIKLEPGEAPETVDLTSFARLRQENRVRVLATVPAAQLAPQIRLKAVSLDKVIQPQR